MTQALIDMKEHTLYTESTLYNNTCTNCTKILLTSQTTLKFRQLFCVGGKTPLTQTCNYTEGFILCCI